MVNLPINLLSSQGGMRKKWAESKCEIVRTGSAFAPCRAKLGGEEMRYYTECVMDACG